MLTRLKGGKAILSPIKIMIVASICIVPLLAFATHGHWIDHYKNASNMPCCGTNDCLVVPMRLISMAKETVTLEIAGFPVTIPRQSFHPSEDTQDYWCATNKNEKPSTQNTRCAFIASGS